MSKCSPRRGQRPPCGRCPYYFLRVDNRRYSHTTVACYRSMNFSPICALTRRPTTSCGRGARLRPEGDRAGMTAPPASCRFSGPCRIQRLPRRLASPSARFSRGDGGEESRASTFPGRRASLRRVPWRRGSCRSVTASESSLTRTSRARLASVGSGSGRSAPGSGSPRPRWPERTSVDVAHSRKRRARGSGCWQTRRLHDDCASTRPWLAPGGGVTICPHRPSSV